VEPVCDADEVGADADAPAAVLGWRVDDDGLVAGHGLSVGLVTVVHMRGATAAHSVEEEDRGKEAARRGDGHEEGSSEKDLRPSAAQRLDEAQHGH
jgi:hypothetical protein